MSSDVIGPFLASCIAEYNSAEAERRPPRAWAILSGNTDGTVTHVERVNQCRNSRRPDDLISQWFGGAYTDTRRAYWCDPNDLLSLMRSLRAVGQSLLGSIHMHADLANRMHAQYYSEAMQSVQPSLPRPARTDGSFWSCSQNHFTVSEQPSPMDEEMLQVTGWPLNVIVFVHRNQTGELQSHVAAYAAAGDLVLRRVPIVLSSRSRTNRPTNKLVIDAAAQFGGIS